MGLIFTKGGLRSYDSSATTLLNWLKSLTLKLFKTNVTITVDSVAADLTICDFGGYADQPANDWTGPTLSANKNDVYALPNHTFSATGPGLPQTVYGAALFDAAGTLVAAQNHGGAGFPLTAAGYAYVVGAPNTVGLGQLAGAA